MAAQGGAAPQGEAGAPATAVLPPTTTAPAPTANPLSHIKEALRILENTHALFTGMKAKVVYACGEGHLLAADDGRQYLARVIKTLDDEHRAIKAGMPRFNAAIEVAKAVGKASARANAAAAASGAAGGHGQAGRAGGAAGAAAAAAAAGPEVLAAAALRSHCRSVATALDCALTESLLAGAATEAALERKAKRQRLEADTRAAAAGAGSGASGAPAAATSPSTGGAAPGVSSPSLMPSSPPTRSAASSAFASGASPPGRSQQQHALELLGVLLRVRALDGPAGGVGPTAAHSSSSSSSSLLGGMRLHVLDDGGNPLSLPSSLPAAVAAATTATAGSSAGGSSSSGSSSGPVSWDVLSGIWLQQVDKRLLATAATRISHAAQVRLLVPGVFVANVLLEAPGSAAPLRVVVDAADRAFDLDPWATPTPQVFRRLSALATRVLAYYIKRAPLNGEAAAVPGSSAGASASAAGVGSSPARPRSAAAGPASPGSPPSANGAAVSAPAPAAAAAAAGNEYAPGPSGSALEDLLLWLLGCRDLFSKRCAATGRLMAWDPSVQFPVPPIFRPFKLPREELRLRALDLSRVAAYHMHVAPIDQLGWAEDVPAQAALALALPGQAVGGAAGAAGGGAGVGQLPAEGTPVAAGGA
ncbi:hypothetical protein HYH02_002765 [Chlamydomonas schloesseri]|uniref:Uncharacterized protein n=1 Tax=Chlamydomonas schloesseri TaxID=2026947 RepID=A0A836BAC0_9CHLO|nr:hypothetical protein HYH02_002765 [Chlamydomonas schloesseri]|eukprot:KAG2452527.1 hypothetical protein HYH02_002765 [Chlamydomonas schloesseri]